MTVADHQFPLALSDFEHYAFRDDSAEHPMVIVLRTPLEGQLDVAAFRHALNLTLQQNPLLRARVEDLWWGRSRWQLLTNHEPSLETIHFETEHPPFHCALRKFDLRQQAGVHFELRTCAERAVLITWFHHACVDGIGGIRFIGDLFAHYGAITAKGDAERPTVRQPNPEVLRIRGSTKMPGNRRDRCAPLCHTLIETARLFLRRSYKLARTSSSPPPPANQTVHNIISTRVLPRTVLKRLRKVAASNGATTNDLCMMVFLQQIAAASAADPAAKSNDLFRILMPVSMRTPEHDEISAANVVSYVFHSFRRDQINSPKLLLAAIREKSHQMLNRNEGAAMLHGFALSRWIPGLFRLSQKAQPNFATAVMTNVGEVRRVFENRFPLKNGRAVAGNVVIQRVDGVAPTRENTNFTMAFGTYGGELIMHLNRNTRLFSAGEADSLLQDISDRVIAIAETEESSLLVKNPVTSSEMTTARTPTAEAPVVLSTPHAQ